MYTYKIIQTKEKLEEATNLIFQVYSKKGYTTHSSRDNEVQKISSYLSSKNATVFGAYLNSKIVGTISILLDNTIDLPMDILFKKELDQIRNKNIKIAEVCQFAINTEMLAKSQENITISINLLSLVLRYGIYKQYDYFSLTINPKHKTFYETIGCTQIGVEKKYPSVNNAPALGYILDLSKTKKELDKETQKNWLLREMKKISPDMTLFK